MEQAALFRSHSEVRAGDHCVVLIPLAIFVGGMEHRVRFGLEIRQMDSVLALSSVCAAVWPRTSYLASLGSNVLICHMEVVVIILLQDLSGLNKG